jgi:hypothetical protein
LHIASDICHNLTRSGYFQSLSRERTGALVTGGKTMRGTTIKTFKCGAALLVALASTAWPGQAQASKSPYPAMAAIEKYLMDRNIEIDLARSAAPAAVSRDAAVMVLGQKGYETAVPGKNGFVCMVERSWGAGFDNPEFWNPKNRSPICFNPPAARSVLPLYLNRTKLILSGESKAQMIAGIQAAFDKKELPTPAPGAMCYMMSKQAYLTDSGNHNLAHLMFEFPRMEASAFGADVPNSPVLVGTQDVQDLPEPMTETIIPVGKWSDGTAAPTE